MQVTVHSEMILNLLTEVGRNRPLADHETDIIERIVSRQSPPIRHIWTAELDGELLEAAKQPGGIAQFAAKYQMTRGGVDVRLHRIRTKVAA